MKKNRVELNSNQLGHLLAMLEVDNFREELGLKDMLESGKFDAIEVIESKETTIINNSIIEAIKNSGYWGVFYGKKTYDLR